MPRFGEGAASSAQLNNPDSVGVATMTARRARTGTRKSPVALQGRAALERTLLMAEARQQFSPTWGAGL